MIKETPIQYNVFFLIQSLQGYIQFYCRAQTNEKKKQDEQRLSSFKWSTVLSPTIAVKNDLYVDIYA